MPVSQVANAPVTTLEGLGTAEKPHPLQEAFITEQARTCASSAPSPATAAATERTDQLHLQEEPRRRALAGKFALAPLRVVQPRRRGNTFANESFMGERAAAGTDSAAFRRRHLNDARAIARRMPIRHN